MNTKLKLGRIATTLSLIAFAATAANAQAGNAPQVTVNDRPVDFQGQPPVEQAGRVLVPLRGVLEKIGAYVEYNAQTHTVTAFRGDTRIRLMIGDNQATIGDRRVSLDVPAQLVNGSTLVPLRFVAESLGAQVAYHADTDTVAIRMGHGEDHASSAVMPPMGRDGGPGRHDNADRHPGDSHATLVGSVVEVSPNATPARITVRIHDPTGGPGTVDRELPIRSDAAFTMQRPNDTQRTISLDHIHHGDQVSVTVGEGGRVTSINLIVSR